MRIQGLVGISDRDRSLYGCAALNARGDLVMCGKRIYRLGRGLHRS